MSRPSIIQLQSLIGNPDAYAVQGENGSYYPMREKLTPAVLRQHLEGKRTVGTYTLRSSLCKTLVFDVDKEENLSAARGDAWGIASCLCNDFGIPAKYIGVEFSGNKGFHVWLVFAQYVSAADARKLGRAVLALTELDCEVFPKQDSTKDLGNLVKLPGGVHRKTGTPNDFITNFPKGLPTSEFDEVVKLLPDAPKVKAYDHADSVFTCMNVAQEGITEGGRNRGLFHYAVMLRRAGLGPENISDLVYKANAKADPPLDDDEVETLIASSANSGPICGQLDECMQCGDACILSRGRGLFNKKGQMRDAATGEFVVVQVTNRKGNVIELEHPDLERAKAALK